MNLDAIPIYDHHAHALYKDSAWRHETFEACFTEAYDPIIVEKFVQDSLYFRRSIRELAVVYDCEASKEAVYEARQSQDFIELAKRLFQKANISHWLIDDGIWPDKLMSINETKTIIPVKIARVMRLETELATFIENYDDASSLLKAFKTHLYEHAPSLMGFKSIIAYRTGLDIQKHTKDSIERSFNKVRSQQKPSHTLRINDKPLLDAALWLALEVATETQTPIQFHTGYGDPDLDMRLANPLHLRAVLEAPELNGLKLLMLHCYPYVKEAGYLASVYSGAYLDLGLTIPYTSRHAMQTSVHEAMHLSPISKILFSTDAQRIPEMFYLAARWAREVLTKVLTETIASGDLSPAEGLWAAERILNKNALELYGDVKD